LSGGQRQRVAIGRALVRDADVFLFDEPLSNLDAKLRTELRVEIKRLHRQLANTMIYVTHDQAEALTLADRIAVMKNGEIQQFDTPSTIYDQPVNRFVAEFIGTPAMNFLSGKLVAESNMWCFIADDVDGLEVPIPDSILIRPEHLRLNPSNAKQSYFHREHPAPATVDLIEPSGADRVIWVRCGERLYCARSNADEQVQLSDVIRIGIDPAKSVLFSEDGRRI